MKTAVPNKSATEKSPRLKATAPPIPAFPFGADPVKVSYRVVGSGDTVICLMSVGSDAGISGGTAKRMLRPDLLMRMGFLFFHGSAVIRYLIYENF